MAKSGIVLIVDDDEVVLMTNRIFLEGAGYEVHTETNPLRLNRAIQANPPDVVLLDVRMPAINGDQVIDILKRYEFSRNIPILLFSDLEESELKALVRRTQADGYVKKSAGQAHLIETVERYVSRRLGTAAV